ncbi:hypothetical protein TNCV_2133391 [Trichonephila clavipes]|nr:hypothetical protein TNCV_2133391 [Trichonephila clavipes]
MSMPQSRCHRRLLAAQHLPHLPYALTHLGSSCFHFISVPKKCYKEVCTPSYYEMSHLFSVDQEPVRRAFTWFVSSPESKSKPLCGRSPGNAMQSSVVSLDQESTSERGLSHLTTSSAIRFRYFILRV